MRQLAGRGPLASFLDAVAFLTRVPVPVRRGFDLAAAAWAFPVVGALVGGAVGLVAVVGSRALPLLVAVALAVLVEVLVTGALHLDGLADCADGCGGRDRGSRLAIMKDHAVGVYGVAAVVLDLLLKVALVHGVLAAREAMDPGPVGGWTMVGVFAGVWALSRAAMLPLARWLPYARGDGTGRTLVEGLGTATVAAGVALAVGLNLLPLLGGLPVLVPAAVALGSVLATALVAAWATSLLGGITGDVLGAAADVVTLTALVALALVLT